MFIQHTKLWKAMAATAAFGLMITACGGAAATPAPDDGSPKVTSTGFNCPEANPRMEVTSTEVNLFVWTEYIPPDTIECFELIYGIKVNRDEYSSNEEMYAKLSSGSTAYDLVLPTDYIVGLMIRQGLLQKLDKSKLPLMSTLDPTYLDLGFDPGNEYTIPYQTGTDAIVVNTDAVENVPVSWSDLWKPEYAGHLIMLDDSRATIGMVLISLGYSPNTQNPAELEAAKVKLAELVPGVKLFESDSPKTALIAGDADLGMTWTGEAFLAQQENPAITYVYPTEGAIVWQDNYAVPVGAPHLDATYAWLNYSMQGDVFWMMMRDFPYTNPVTTSIEYSKNSSDADIRAIYDAYFNSPITNTPPEEIARGHRIDDVGEATPIYDQIWTEVKGG